MHLARGDLELGVLGSMSLEHIGGTGDRLHPEHSDAHLGAWRGRWFVTVPAGPDWGVFSLWTKLWTCAPHAIRALEGRPPPAIVLRIGQRVGPIGGLCHWLLTLLLDGSGC